MNEAGAGIEPANRFHALWSGKSLGENASGIP